MAHRPRLRTPSRRGAAKLAAVALAATMLTASQGRLNDFQERMLASHNRERAVVGAPPLRWNDKLASDAQRWADHLSSTGRFEHAPQPAGSTSEGENIWGGTPDYFTPESMVDMWIEEKRFFKHGAYPANSTTGRIEDVGHYTQLIWRRTEEVGCAVSGKGDEEILVCRYAQPGNVRGRKPL